MGFPVAMVPSRGKAQASLSILSNSVVSWQFSLSVYGSGTLLHCVKNVIGDVGQYPSLLVRILSVKSREN